MGAGQRSWCRPKGSWPLGTRVLAFIFCRRWRVRTKVGPWIVLSFTMTPLASLKITSLSPQLKWGLCFHGLYLHGAGWDRKGFKLVEPTRKVLYASMPVSHIYAINTTAGRDSRMYQCSIYKKPWRIDLTYIATADLKTNQNPDHWILREVALLWYQVNQLLRR